MHRERSRKFHLFFVVVVALSGVVGRFGVSTAVSQTANIVGLRWAINEDEPPPANKRALTSKQ